MDDDNVKIAYQAFSDSKTFKQEVCAFLDEKGNYKLPLNSSFNKPSFIIKTGFIEVLNDNLEWVFVEDNLDKDAWNKNTKEKVKINYTGKLKLEHTLKSIPNYDFIKYFIFDDKIDDWILTENKRDEILDLIYLKFNQITENIINNSQIILNDEQNVLNISCSRTNQLNLIELYLTKDIQTYPIIIWEGNNNYILNNSEDVIRVSNAVFSKVQEIRKNRKTIRDTFKNIPINKLLNYIKNGDTNEIL